MSLIVRAYRAEDAAALGRLFFDSVHRGTAAAYTEAQRAAWAPAPPDDAEWAERLAGAASFVAQSDGAPIGFMTLVKGEDGSGLVDLAFVHPDHIGAGVASVLYQALEEKARACGLNTLWTDASDVARPFFAAKGFAHIRVQHPVRDGVQLTNHRMEKRL